MGLLTGIMSGLVGGLQLYSGVKGLFSDKQAGERRALANMRAAEQAWYNRNYYNDYLNNSIARAAMKRVENTLSRNSRQNRAYAAVSGATPETMLAANGQGLSAMDNLVTNLAAQEDARRASVDAGHLQNVNNFQNRQAALDAYRKPDIDPELIGGMSLIEDALAGVTWGKENDKKQDGQQQGDANAKL